MADAGLSMFDVEDMTGKDLNISKGIDLRLVETEEDMKNVFDSLMDVEGPIALDTETTGLSPLHEKIVGVILAPSAKLSYYFPLRHLVGDNLNEASFIYYFKQLCEKKKFILFHAEFDWAMVKVNWGIDFDIEADVQIMAYICDSNLAESKNLSLKHLTKEILHYQPLELSDFGITNFSLLDTHEAYKYAAPDGTNTFELWEYYKPKIKELKLEKVFRIEHNIIKAVAQMELNGIPIEIETLKEQKDSMLARINELEKKIYFLAGHEFDLQSPKQMGVVFYDELGMKPLVKNGKEDRSVSKTALEYLYNKHPIVKLVKAYREVTKLYNDFIVKLPDCIAEDTHLHGNFNPLGTRSGRFSASGGFGKGGAKISVNVQQMPKGKGYEVEETAYIPSDLEDKFDFDKEYDEKELKSLYPEYKTNKNGKPLSYISIVPVKIREAFTASPGHYWLSCDYSQLEYRCLANLAMDKYLVDSFNKGIDFHEATAATLFDVPVEKVDKAMRKRGKTLNFGIVYGMSNFGLAERLGVDVKEANTLIDKYFSDKPGVVALKDNVKASLLAHGYVRTFSGRIRWFKEQLKAVEGDDRGVERIAKQGFNTAIQGSGADFAKVAMYRAYELLKPYGDKIKMISMIHDELNFDVSEEVPKEEAIAVIDAAMSFLNPLPGWCDIPGDIEIGPTYGEMKEIDELGYDIKKIREEYKFDIPDTSFIFEGNGMEVISTPKKSLKTKAKSQYKKAADLDSGYKRPTTPKKSHAEMLGIKKEEKKEEVGSLEGKQFKIPSVYLKFKDDKVVPDAITALKKFIADNFGNYTLFIEHEGLIYKFPSEYTVSDKVDGLENYFDVTVGKPKAKVKISI